MAKKASAFKDFTVIGLARMLVMLSSLILLPVLSKTWGEHEYGMWVLLITAVGLLVPIASFGLPFAMVRFLASADKIKDRVKIQDGFYSVSLAVFGIGALFGAGIYAAFTLYFTSFGLEQSTLLVFSALLPVSCIMFVPFDYLRTFRKMGMYAIFTVAQVYAEVILISYLVLSGEGLHSALLATLAVRIIAAIILFAYTGYSIGFKAPKFKAIKEYLGFGLPTVPSGISSWLVSYSDRYIIGLVLTVAWVGIYNPAYTLGTIIMVVPAIYGFLFPPILSKLYDEGKKSEVKRYLSESLKYYLFLAIPFMLGSFLVSEEILIMLSTESIASQGYQVVPVVAFATLMYGIYVVSSQVLVLTKQTKVIGYAWVFAAVLNISLNFFIVPTELEVAGITVGGIMGAALTTVFAYTLTAIIITAYAMRKLRFTVKAAPLIKCIGASLAMFFVIWYIQQSISSIFILIPVGLIVYAGMLFGSKAITKHEIERLFSFIKR